MMLNIIGFVDRLRFLKDLLSRDRSCKLAFLVPENAVYVWTEGKN